MCPIRSIGGKSDGRMVKNIQPLESTLTCRSINDVSVIQHGQDGHLNQGQFGSWGERGAITIEETKSRFKFSLQCYALVLVFCVFFNYLFRPGCDMGLCYIVCSYWGLQYLGLRLSRGVVQAWLPEAVLNQSQVILVVSDWEPYLGSLGFALYFVGDCSCLCVVSPDRLYQVSRSVLLFCICIVISCIALPSLKT